MFVVIFVAQFVVAGLAVLAIGTLGRNPELIAGITSGRGALTAALICGAVGVAVLELISLKFSSPPNLFWDYLNAYDLAGRDVAGHHPEALRALIGQGTTGFVNIPVVAYLFAPFALVPPKVAALAYTAIGLVSTIGAWFLLVRLADLGLRERWLLGALFLANGPLINGVKFGNLSYFILAMFAGGLMLVRTNRPGLAGALLGLAAVLKPPLAIFGLFFLLRRDVRGLSGFAAVGFVTVLLSLAIFGWTDNYNWFETVIVKYSHTWLSTFSVQSIPAFILRLRPGIGIDYLDSATVLPTASESYLAAAATFAVFIIAASAWIAMQIRNRNIGGAGNECQRDFEYLLVICLVLVSSPLSWDRYFCWLLMPAAFFLKPKQGLATSRVTTTIGWIAIALVTPLVMRPVSLGALGRMPAFKMLFVSHLLFGALVWFGLVAWALATYGQKADCASDEVKQRHVPGTNFA